jgi:serine/threonine protein kinase
MREKEQSIDMRAPQDLGSMSADESRFVGAPPLAPAADSAIPSVQARLAPAGHESEADISQLIDVAVQREHTDDETPTDQLLPSPQQLPTTSEMRVELAPGSVLRSRYILEDTIGRGGTSIIFRARDLHRTSSQHVAANFVAIKLLRPEHCADPRALIRLKREFQQMQSLSHPGIVRVFDLDCDGQIWFISMELVAGQTVKTWIETPASHANALRIIGACGAALEHAHSLGILHGDVKPTNVMVTDDGTAKLIDFGSAPGPGSLLAARSDPTLAATPLYASPQILSGKSAEPRDDVYSLACLSYNILSGGRHPYDGRPSLEDGRAKSAPTYVREIPIGLFTVIERGLSVERERRAPSVRQFLDDLTDAARLHCADSSSAATRTGGNVNAVHHPAVVMRADDPASRSTPLPFFGKIRLRAPISAKGSATEIASAAFRANADGFGHGRGSYGRAQPFVRQAALVSSIMAAAVFFWLSTSRDVIRAPESAPQASAISPEPVATARAKSEIIPETKRLLHDSGVISFEASTVHASAVQSLVAISVKRLPATSRAAFVWRVERGTAQPGVDYEGVQPQVVRFIEGQTVRTLFIPLISNPETLVQRRPRTFTVALERVKGGPALGRFARVTVSIDPPPTSNPSAFYQARANE